MRTRLLMYFFIMLVALSLVGQAFGLATATITPSQVPKGAYVNGPGGATDDNYYWQALKITFGGDHIVAASAITIILPTGMEVADTDGAGDIDNDISLSWVTGGTTFVVNAATATNTINLDTVTAPTVNTDYVWVMFPVTTLVNPGVASAGYTINFTDNTPDANITAASGPQITYRDAGALDVSPFADNVSGDNDSTSTYGQMYPAVTAAMWTALPDFVKDTGTTLFRDMVTNGTFTGNATGWTLAGSAAYNANNVNLVVAGVAGSAQQNVGVVAGQSYTLTYTLSGVLNGGEVTPTLGGVSGALRVANGTYTDVITTFTTGNLIFNGTDPGGGGNGTAVLDDVIVKASNGVDTDDITFTLWASTDSTLSHVNILTSGVTRAVNFETSANYTVNEGATGSAARIATAALTEGNYYFYITSSLTGDFPLVRSGQLHIRHYPEVKILGWDYDGAGVFDNATNTDDASLTLDTGLYFGYTGAVGAAARDDANIYINVEDYDDNARVYLFYSTNSGLTVSSITTSGTSPSLVVTGLTGATVLADTLYENTKDVGGFIRWNWDVTPVGTSYIAANSYTLYVVANDGKHQGILASKGSDATDQETLTIKHSPNLTIDALAEYDSNTGDADIDILTANNDVIIISWGKSGVSGDSDIDDSALIELYIDLETGTSTDYASTDAAALRAAVDNLPGGVHRIVTGLQENPDSRSSSYYVWNLKTDFAATGWYPTDAAKYYLYAIIDENKSGGTARVVALGDGGLLTLGENLMAGAVKGDLIFTNAAFARLYDPPVDGVTVYGDQTYRFNFSAFDFDNNADIGIWAVRTTGTGFTTGPATTAIATINGAGAGNMYCLTSTTGDDAAAVYLKENTNTYYDLTVRLPTEGTTRYTTDNAGGAPDMNDGTYWIYIGDPVTDVFYRAPGTITFKNIANADVPSQKNLLLTPSVFTTAKGDTMTFSVRAAGTTVVMDLIDAYIAVEKTYFDVVSSSTPFTEGAALGSLIANETINDTANNRWILHTTVFNAGTAITSTTNDLGDVEATFRLVSKGTTNALGATSSIYFVNEPVNGWVSKFTNDGSTVSINVQQNSALVQPRGIIEGIVEFEGRLNSNYQVNFELRKRGSYEVISDSTLSAVNDADAVTTGIQYTLDSDGKFSMYRVPSGIWDFVVSYNRYLAKKQEIKVEAGLDTLFVNFGKLLGGDCIGYTDSLGAAWPNNRINADDVGRISTAFLATSSHTRWNDGVYNYKWADIDESGTVGIADLQMATANFIGSNNDGAQPVWAKPAIHLLASNDGALVEFDNLPAVLTAGKTYTVQVVIRNSGAVRGYFVNLTYDQTKLAVESIAKGDFITTNSQWFPVREDGTIGLANASYGRTIFSGDGVLAELKFTARTSGAFSPDMLGVGEASVVNADMIAENLVVTNPTGITNVPVNFALNQNFPNPFNPTTTISFTIPQNGNVTLRVYDVLGRCARTLVSGYYSAGNYSVVWDAADTNGSMVSAGIYFYVIEAGNYHATKRMMYIK